MLDQARNQFAALPSLKAEDRGVHLPIVITLILCLLGLVMVYAAINISALLVVGETMGVILGLALVVVAWRNWEVGVQTLLVVIIIEGAVRKWFLPSYAALIYFYKDALMGAILVSYWMARDKAPLVIKQQMKLFLGVVAAFSLYAFAVVINPSAPHIVTSLMGFKVYCLYVPLVWLVPRAFPTKEKLVAFLQWYLVIALAVAALGAWQFIDGNPESALNRYAWGDEVGGVAERAIFADSSGTYYLRVTSTFSFITGLTVYLPVAFALLLGLTSLHTSRALPTWKRWLYYAAMGGVVMTAFMTGSRSVILSLVIATIIFYAFTSVRDMMRRARQLSLAAIICILTISTVSPQVIDAMYTRAFGGETQIEEGRERMGEVFTFPSEAAEHAGAFGYGIGATQNGVPALINRLGLTPTGDSIPIEVESESSRVMIELGIVGFILFGLLRISIFLVLWHVCISIRDPEKKALAVAAFAATVFPLVAGGAVVIHTQNVYQWFLVGMALALFNADRLALQAQATAAASGWRQVAASPLRNPLIPAAGEGGIAR